MPKRLRLLNKRDEYDLYKNRMCPVLYVFKSVLEDKWGANFCRDLAEGMVQLRESALAAKSDFRHIYERLEVLGVVSHLRSIEVLERRFYLPWDRITDPSLLEEVRKNPRRISETFIAEWGGRLMVARDDVVCLQAEHELAHDGVSSAQATSQHELLGLLELYLQRYYKFFLGEENPDRVARSGLWFLIGSGLAEDHQFRLYKLLIEVKA